MESIVVVKTKKTPRRQKLLEFFVRRYGKKFGKSKLKRYRRLLKYKRLNQYKDGVFYCKSGKPITEERVLKYEGMSHALIREYFPALYVNEAAYNYDDLLSSCRIEIFLALLNGFDPEKALTSNKENPEERAKIEKRKRENIEFTLAESEKSIVWGRLNNYLRRTRWKNHPAVRGGMTGSLDYLYERAASLYETSLSVDYKIGAYIEPTEERPEIVFEKDKLLNLVREQGPAAAKKKFLRMGKDKREAIVDMLRKQNLGSRMMSRILNEEVTNADS